METGRRRVRRALVGLATRHDGQPPGDGGRRSGADPGRRPGAGRGRGATGRHRRHLRWELLRRGAGCLGRPGRAVRIRPVRPDRLQRRYRRVVAVAELPGSRTSLDVGCATGFLVEVLRERGIDAQGCDVSQFAIDHAAPGAVGHVRVANLFAGLPWADALLRTGDRPGDPRAPAPGPGARRPGRTGAGCAAATSTPPSRRSGRTGREPTATSRARSAPSGWTHYRGLGPDYLGPVPEADLAVDADGQLVEGHLTIASFEWWTEQFARAGFTRCPDIERTTVRRHRAGRSGPVLEHLRLQGRRALRDVHRRAPASPTGRLAELGLRHPLLER